MAQILHRLRTAIGVVEKEKANNCAQNHCSAQPHVVAACYSLSSVNSITRAYVMNISISSMPTSIRTPCRMLSIKCPMVNNCLLPKNEHFLKQSTVMHTVRTTLVLLDPPTSVQCSRLCRCVFFHCERCSGNKSSNETNKRRTVSCVYRSSPADAGFSTLRRAMKQ